MYKLENSIFFRISIILCVSSFVKIQKFSMNSFWKNEIAKNFALGTCVLKSSLRDKVFIGRNVLRAQYPTAKSLPAKSLTVKRRSQLSLFIHMSLTYSATKTLCWHLFLLRKILISNEPHHLPFSLQCTMHQPDITLE